MKGGRYIIIVHILYKVLLIIIREYSNADILSEGVRKKKGRASPKLNIWYKCNLETEI